MNQNKTAIFEVISNSLSEANSDQYETIEAKAKALLNSPSSLIPSLPVQDPLESFRDRINSEKIAGSIESIASIEHLPAAVDHYISSHHLPAQIALQPIDSLLQLDWKALNIKHHASSDEQLAVTIGQWGIAETGSVVISSAPDSPVLLNFLPSHHILVLFEKNILANLEDYAQKIDSLSSQRVVCLITGASGTTDIEGVLVNGAHGPEHLHIITVKSD